MTAAIFRVFGLTEEMNMHTLTKHLPLVFGCAALTWNPVAMAQNSPAGSPPSKHESRAEADNASVGTADRKFYAQLTEANLAEVASSRQALDKSNDQKIKAFAQHMVEDHGAALEELTSAAKGKRIELPTVADEKHRKMAERMEKMSSSEFNAQYAKAAVEDHEATLKLLDNILSGAKDKELRTLAAKMKPKVQSHLKMAKDLNPGASR
jgi:putative membrane protein